MKIYGVFLLQEHNTTSNRARKGRGWSRFGSLLTGGSSTISCKSKTERTILLEKVWGGRRIGYKPRCVQRDKTPG